MSEAGSDKPMTREERLAAQLRANLRRRKAQARAMERAEDSPAVDSTSPLFKPGADG